MDTPPKSTERDITEIKNIIPVMSGAWREQTEENAKAAIEYLNNPCIVIVRLRLQKTGEVGEEITRVAVGLRTDLDTRTNVTVETKGIDFDVSGGIPIKDLLAGVRVGQPPYRTDEIYTYGGRLSDILESENPPKREKIEKLFSSDKQMLSENLV
ncbi:MAG: hypothetical protein ABIM99_02685 [Candidatus Dojkabacteria bacterium]